MYFYFKYKKTMELLQATRRMLKKANDATENLLSKNVELKNQNEALKRQNEELVALLDSERTT